MANPDPAQATASAESTTPNQVAAHGLAALIAAAESITELLSTTAGSESASSSPQPPSSTVGANPCSHMAFTLQDGGFPFCTDCGRQFTAEEFSSFDPVMARVFRAPSRYSPELSEELLGRKNTEREGKSLIRYDLIPPGPLEDLAKLYGFGAAKYSARNWERGFAWSTPYNAALRHLQAFWNGEDMDDGPEGSGLPHVIALAWNAFALAQFMITHRELDDRPRVATPVPPPQ